jgi:hypothetical protein
MYNIPIPLTLFGVFTAIRLKNSLSLSPSCRDNRLIGFTALD